MAPRWAGSPREDSPCDSPSRTTEDPHQGRHRTGEHLSILGGVSLKGRFSVFVIMSWTVLNICSNAK